MRIEEIFNKAIETNASDIHLLPNHYPTYRINGSIVQLRLMQKLSPETVKELVISTLTHDQNEFFYINKEIDYGYTYMTNGSTYRFRINAYYSRGNISASLRLVPTSISKLRDLNLPNNLENIIDMNQGLVLITGPTGHGKSTTLASLINGINERHAKHILTIEDPIEYFYPEGRSIISQREIGNDTHNWKMALKSALREDPDVVLIGEMRDFETIQSALTISETGHLVLSTLHTNTAAQTIDRIIDVFPSNQQNQIRSQLAATLKVIFCQRLVQNIDSSKRLPAYEMVFVNNAFSNLIRENKTHLMDNLIETSIQENMVLFEQTLIHMIQNGLISDKQAMSYSLRPKLLAKLLENK